jgi:toxin FitB
VRYLLDTCVVSELVRAKPNAKVVKWLEGCDEDSLFLSVLTVGEIQKGIARLDDASRKETLQQWLDGELRARFGGRILPVTEDVSLAWGAAQADAERKGTPIPTIDGLLAATAVAHNLTVVTRNENDFARTSARVLNPWRL